MYKPEVHPAAVVVGGSEAVVEEVSLFLHPQNPDVPCDGCAVCEGSAKLISVVMGASHSLEARHIDWRLRSLLMAMAQKGSPDEHLYPEQSES